MTSTTRGRIGEIGSAIGWLAFPVVPVVLAQLYYGALNNQGIDPRDWSWEQWLTLTGPLLGFGFLAGATLSLPDDPSRRGVRSVFARRGVWVVLGPWWGFLVCGVAVVIAVAVDRWIVSLKSSFWTSDVLNWLVLGIASQGWLIVAVAALRRARRLGRLGAALGRGLTTAIGFVGSLLGGFWAATSIFRSYFFDPTVVKSVLLALSAVVLLGGCADTVTVGDVRRRKLFDAMLLAWVIGLALAWQWWSRSRRKK